MASTVLPNGIIIPEKFSRDWYADLYHNWQELDNLLGGGTPKDGTLTIQKNGSTVGTFSANQATNETIDITVPTATSELTNDSNFVESSDLATVATSGSYTDLSDKPTIPTVNDATLTIQKNGTDVATFSANSSTNATANITVPTKTSDLTNDSGFITEDTTKIPLAGSNQISGSLIPNTDGTVNLGSSSYQWNNLYAKNYFYNGVAWGLDKVNTWTAQQNITGNNYRGSISMYNSAYTKGGTLSVTDLSIGTIYMGDAGQQGIANSLGFVSTDLASNGARTLLSLSAMENTASSAARTNVVIQYDKNDAENPRKVVIQGSILPQAQATYSLGTSTAKWKSFNGVNPGALSLPSGTVGMNLIGDVSVVGTEKKLSKDITVTGYIYVDVSFTSNNRLNLFNDTKKYGIWIPCDSGRIRQIMPISAGDRLEFNVLDAGSTVNAIQLFPCQGNV